MKNKILLVEDDATLTMILAETLEREGFEIISATDGEDGLKKFSIHKIDLIIADVMMPHMDGFTMTSSIRKVDPNIPILFLTARGSIEDLVNGFNSGGNDYLRKPFKMLELIVRIKALLKLNIKSKQEQNLKIGNYVLNSSLQQLTFEGKKPIALSLIESSILSQLAMNIGFTVEASTIMMMIWHRDDLYTRNSLHGFIHKIRYYLRFDTRIQIINQRGIGYKLTING